MEQIASDQIARADVYERVRKALEWPMAVLALAVIPAILLEEGGSPSVHLLASTINWVIWIAFCAEFLICLRLAPDRAAFVRASWFDLAIIIISPPLPFIPESAQGLRAARALRLLRLLRVVGVLSIGLKASRRALRHNNFHYVLMLAAAVVAFGAGAIYFLEHSQNENIQSLGDALWWAISTTTTVGYGDIYPTTGEGRLIAVVLMLTGIGVIGVFTATIASFLMIDEKGDDDRLEQRLQAVEEKLDRVLRNLRESERN